MKFKDYFSLKQILFAVLLFALLIPIALWDSNTQIKVAFGDDSISVRSDRYNMAVAYDDIASAELAELANPGEKVEDGFDDDIVRAGKWRNEVWGEYYINADLDAINCIVMELKDGRIFVFNCKNNDETVSLYEQLLTHLP